MKEELPVSLLAESRLGSGDTCETVSVSADGCLRQVGGVCTLSYTSGNAGQKVFTTLSFRPGEKRLHLKQRGGIRSEIVFDPSLPHMSVYEVPPHRFDLTVRCLEMRASFNYGNCDIFLRYERELGGDSTPVEFHLSAEAREVEV